MHESEKWKWSRSVVSDSSDPMDCSPPASSIHGIFQAKVLEWGAIAFPRLLIIANTMKMLCNSCKYNVNSCQCMANSSVDFWNFLKSFFPNIFNLWLVDSANAKPLDSEDQLYYFQYRWPLNNLEVNPLTTWSQPFISRASPHLWIQAALDHVVKTAICTIEKHLWVGGPAQFTPVSFKGQLYC